VTATGFGAGTRTLEHLPNVTQVVLGTAASDIEAGGQTVVEVAANVDDVTGETLAHAVAALFDAGALDAWVTPVLMKKGRPGHVVSALADDGVVAQVVATLMAETGTLGVRGRRVERWVAQRSAATVDIGGLPVRVKVSPGRVKAEHDDAARAARLSGLPAREVARRAEDAWRAQGEPWSDDPA